MHKPHPIRRGLVLALVSVAATLVSAATAMAGTATVDGSVLRYTAAADEQNRVTITEDEFNQLPVLRVTDTGAPVVAGSGCVQDGASSAVCSPTASAIAVLLGNLGDTVDLIDVGSRTSTLDGGTDSDTLNGGPNADAITGGPDALDDILRGEAGADSLDGGAGDDTLQGGGGNDTLDGGPGPAEDASDQDTIDGGGETDTVDYSARTGDVFVTIGAPASGDGEAGEGDDVTATVEDVTTGSGDDDVTGSDAPNELDGNAGADTLAGGGGDDDLDGGAGGDTLRGDAGDDTLAGAGDADTLDGGGDDDTLNGDAGDDTLLGGAGADTFNGDDGTDIASYADHAAGVTADIDGAAGDDGNAEDGEDGARDTIATDVENLAGTDAGDTLTGSPTANVLSGAGGADTLAGGGGTGPDGGDTFNGGDGGDTVTYATRTDAVTVDIDDQADDGAAAEGDDVRLDVENVTGGGGNDRLTGSDLANTLHGGNGNDTLDGRLGPDVLQGGAGTDTVTYAGRTVPVVVTLDGLANDGAQDEGDSVGAVPNDVERLVGGTAGDRLRGTTGNQRLDGGAGNDVLIGEAGNDELIGGADTDTVSYEDRTGAVRADLDGDADDGETGETDRIDVSVENLTGGAGDDQLFGSPSANVLDGLGGADLLNGAGGDDTLRGGAGTDTLEGETGADTLLGEADADTLSGAGGNDTLDGGAGNDPLVDGGGGTDTVTYAGRSYGVVVDLAAGKADDAASTATLDETLVSVENAVGGTAADVLRGDAAANRLEGGAGNDDLEGRGGSDVLLGQAGTDAYSGGDGDDLITSRDNLGENVDCGAGTDSVVADRIDVLSGCENADRGAAPTLAVSDATVSESGDATFTITQSAPTSDEVTVDYATADGTATAGSDYAARSGTLTFEPGETSKTVTVDVIEDTTDEPNETFTLVLSNAAPAGAATIGDATGTGTIVDNDGVPTVTVDDVTAGEAADATFTVALSNPAAQQVTVDFATTDGTAAAGSDYTARSGTLTFAPGETSKTVTVDVLDDATDEPNETFGLALSAATNATLDDANGTATIVDNDGVPSIAVDDVTVPEADDATFTVTLSNPTTEQVTVDFATAEGTATAGDDFTGRTGTLTFAPGETSKTVTVTVTDDTADEPDETFTLALTNAAHATIADATGTATIADDDGVPSVSVNDVRVDEAGDATFAVTLSNASSQTVTVDFSTAGGTATAGSDFTSRTGTVTFPAGQTERSVTVEVTDDDVDEPDEAFTLALSNPVNASLADASGTATIADDDGGPTVTVADAAAVTEGDRGTREAAFTVRLSEASEQTVRVDAATADGTARAGEDYTAVSTTLTFSPGQRSRTVAVVVHGDAAVEPDEDLALRLTNAREGTLGTDRATARILNDDRAAQPAAPAVSVEDARTAEGRPLAFRVVLSAPASGAVTVRFATENGTAVAPGEYAPATGTVSFAAGETAKVVEVTTVQDSVDEPDETLGLRLSAPSGATIRDGAAVGLIADDDAPAVARVRAAIRVSITPARDRRFPYAFTAKGQVVPGAGAAAGACRNGIVSVQYKSGTKTVSTRRYELTSNCRFRVRTVFRDPSRLPKRGRLKVTVRFLGSAALLPRSAKARFVRVR